MILSREISLDTKGNGDTINITRQIAQQLTCLAISNGTVNVLVAHTSCGVTIMEHEPGLVSDFNDMWERNAPPQFSISTTSAGGTGMATLMSGHLCSVPRWSFLSLTER
jgi:thiamine phosphate synthase YjbQ (UPF0047 family)